VEKICGAKSGFRVYFGPGKKMFVDCFAVEHRGSAAYVSAAGNALAVLSKKAGMSDVGVVYKPEKHGWSYSFRSTGETDVEEIVSWHGGGGHRQAAGCTAQWFLQKIPKAKDG
jgi:nanoRNase/pAp phosphatase (c-di-AMP/oligoRNAs hydrolase)